MLKSRQTFAKLVPLWIVCIVVFFWLSTRSKPNLNTIIFTQKLTIAPELVSIPNKLGYLWTSTRDNIQRKSTFPSQLHYRYGLTFNIKNNHIHLFLCILLAGDVATNPGPTYNTSRLSSLKRIHKDTRNT